MAVTAGGGSYSTAAGRAANARAVAGMSTNAATKKFAAPAKMKPLPLRKAAVTRRAVTTRKPPPVRPNATGQYGRSAPSAPADVAPGIIEPPAPPVPSETDYLASDQDYLQQQAGFNKGLTDFLSAANLNRTKYTTDTETARRQLGEAKTKDFQSLLDDFAGRGLLTSGVYQNEYDTLGKTYSERGAGIDKNLADLLASLSQEETQYRGDQALAEQQARQDALARRAATYGL